MTYIDQPITTYVHVFSVMLPNLSIATACKPNYVPTNKPKTFILITVPKGYSYMFNILIIKILFLQIYNQTHAKTMYSPLPHFVIPSKTSVPVQGVYCT